MSTESNEILFNSPALHSLKRAQLASLCKRYGIKASGKNTEIVEKLKFYASGLSETLPESLDADAGENKDTHESNQLPDQIKQSTAIRASEQWEVVEEDSREEDMHHFKTMNHSKSNLSTIGEFGGEGTSSKSASVSSSIKAFATSLKRAATGPSFSIAHAHAPSPAAADELQAAGFIGSPRSPSLSPSICHPADTSLSPSALQNTIRLVSSQSNTVAPPSPEYPFPFAQSSSLFPPLSNTQDEPLLTYPSIDLPNNLLPGSFPFPSEATSLPPSLPSTSNIQFQLAASSVLEEMNKRLGLQGTSAALDLDVLQTQINDNGKRTRPDEAEYPIKINRGPRFSDVHNKDFEKMDSILNHYSVRQPRLPGGPRKSAFGPPSSGKKKRKSSATSRKASGAKVSLVFPPVALGENDTTKVAVTFTNTIDAASTSLAVENHQTSNKSRAKVQIVVPNADATMRDDVVLVKDDTMKKKVDAVKARRRSRSSMGRQSMGKTTLLGTKPKSGFGGKFGFLKSSARLVKNAWNAALAGDHASTGSAKPSTKIPKVTSASAHVVKSAAPTVSAPFQSAASRSKEVEDGHFQHLSKGVLAGKAAPRKSMKTPITPARLNLPVSRTPSTTFPHPPPSSIPRLASSSKMTNASSTISSISSRNTASISSTSRGPIPSFNSRSSSLASRVSGMTGMSGRSTGQSSLSSVSSQRNSAIRGRSGSTLLAPTASSLARMQTTVRPSVTSPSEIGTTARRWLTPTVDEHSTAEGVSRNQSHLNPASPKSPLNSELVRSPETPILRQVTNQHSPMSPVVKKTPSGRRPRISRSRIIAKLGEKRDELAAPALAAPRPGRSSLALQARTRRSLDSRSAKRRQVEESFKRGSRKSEIARRKSRIPAMGSKIQTLSPS